MAISGLPHSGWVRRSGSIPWQEIPLVRLGCDEEGLELAVEHDGLWSSVFQSHRPGKRDLETSRFEMEGNQPSCLFAVRGH